MSLNVLACAGSTSLEVLTMKIHRVDDVTMLLPTGETRPEPASSVRDLFGVPVGDPTPTAQVRSL